MSLQEQTTIKRVSGTLENAAAGQSAFFVARPRSSSPNQVSGCCPSVPRQNATPCYKGFTAGDIEMLGEPIAREFSGISGRLVEEVLVQYLTGPTISKTFVE